MKNIIESKNFQEKYNFTFNKFIYRKRGRAAK